MSKVRILCYHCIRDSSSLQDVSPKAFKRQMEFLSQNGYNSITLDEFTEFKDRNVDPPPKTIVITFDDGHKDGYDAFTILLNYNLKGTFFIITNNIGSMDFLSKEEILGMDAQGACFGSHTKSHCHLTQTRKAKAMEEIRDSKRCLEEILQKPVKCFSYPYGYMEGWVKNLVQAEYQTAVAHSGSVTIKSNFLELRRISIDNRDSLGSFIRKVKG